MLKRLIWRYVMPIVIIIVIVLIFLWFHSTDTVSLKTQERIDITPTQIQDIQDIGQWEFLAINDEEMVDTISRGFFSDSELVRIYYGTIRLGIDLHKAEPQWLRVEKDSIVTATLPPIELLDRNFIDETRSHAFFEKGKWSNNDREQMYQRAYKKMLARCLTPANIAIAEENARQQFTQFLKSMGYKHVRVITTPSPSTQQGKLNKKKKT